MTAEAKIWVAGGGGMLGRAVMAALARRGLDHVGSGREVDVADAEAVRRFADVAAPSHIVNCAAYTAVDDAEDDEEAADRVNAAGARQLAELAAERGIGLTQVSTDYVFDGRRGSPYPVDAVCAPQSAYGRTKRRGEEAVLATLDAQGARRVQVVRTSWLFGAGGGNFVTTMLRLMAERATLQVVADQQGRPTFTRDLADALLTIATGAPSGVYHFANAVATTWHGFATTILAEARRRGMGVVTEHIEAVDTRAFPRPAPRPANSVLDTSSVEGLGITPRPWADALGDYLDELIA